MASRSPVLVSHSSTLGAVIRFAAFGAVATLVVGLLLAMAYTGIAERRAIIIGACIALPLQVATFAGVRSVSREHVISAWMGGTLVRFVALVVYGFLVVKALALPSGAALVSFAAFLFALTLIEPLLLNRS
ncbi:MAG TPA: hypothetical protein VG432_02145 [Gemmatimonadaceae bacterium]|nr:hypothetical protein [Gemmatimonadaceae bacterium]